MTDPDDEDWYDDTSLGIDAELDDSDSIPCPECGAALYDDADHCPQCGHWLTDADRDSFPSRRVRIVALIILVIFVAVLILGGVAMF